MTRTAPPRRLPLARLLALLLACGAGAMTALAEDTVVNRPAGSAPEQLKQGRVVKDDVADTIIGAGFDRPLQSDPPPANGTAKGTGASAGLTLLERMGASLPPLPPEKPFTGKIDEAYGAYQRGLFLTAMEKALPRAQLGDAAAQTLIGELLAGGLGVKKDPKAAAFWYKQAADHGDAGAMFRYAILLVEGEVVKRDKAKADELMTRAADAGNASAQFNHAQVLVGAHPGPEGLKLALPYYEKSARQGIADAQYAVAEIYMALPELGDDRKDKALYWIERAARAGFDTAQLDLGLWLVNGTAGPRNAAAGFKWLKVAALQGNISAANKVAHLLINAIGTRPDPVEAAKWYVISRRAGLADPELEDFFLGIEDDKQAKAIAAADVFRPRR